MLSSLLFAFQTVSTGNLSFFIENDSPKTIFLEKDQGLMVISWNDVILKIIIPEVFSSPRYAYYPSPDSYDHIYYFFSFKNKTKIEMYFLGSISYYTLNVSNYTGYIDNSDNFLCKNLNVINLHIILHILQESNYLSLQSYFILIILP